MYYRLGHCEPQVKEGDVVKRGQQVATNGTGNGQWPAHCHFDIFKEKPSAWTNFVIGWTKEQVEAVYADPRGLEKVVLPLFDHYGYEWLQDADYSGKHAFHSGIDLNGKGSGDSDLGDPLCSPVDGVVVFVHHGTDSNGGWGDMVIIQETQETMTKDFVEQVALSCGKSKDYYGENINEKEQDDATDRLKKYREDQNEAIDKLTTKLQEATDAVETFKGRAGELSDELQKKTEEAKALIIEKETLEDKIKEYENAEKDDEEVSENEEEKEEVANESVTVDSFTAIQLIGALFRKIKSIVIITK